MNSESWLLLSGNQTIERLDIIESMKRVESFNQLSKISQLAILKIIFERGASIRMTVFGNSMFPFIRNGDLITISPNDEMLPEVGDMVAFEQARNQKLIIHRLIRKEEKKFVMKGDNCQDEDEAVPISHLLGIVTQVERKNRVRNFGISQFKICATWLSQMNILHKVQVILKLPIKFMKFPYRKIISLFPYLNNKTKEKE